MPRLKPGDDRGSASTLVVLLLATGVLLGMAALVVDVGQLYAEREELQTGADAAAMTVALDCAKRRAACTDLGLANAEAAADANATDNRASVLEFCGRNRAATLPACNLGDEGNLTDCIGSPEPGVNYIQVRTRTEVATDNFILPFTFAQTMSGTADGATVGACSRVAFGPPSTALAMSISACEYDRDRAKTVSAPPWTSAPPAGREVAVGIHAGTVTTCSIPPPPGFSPPAGMRWVDRSSGGGCRFDIEADLLYDREPPSSACRSQLAHLRDTRQVVALAVHDGEIGFGTNAKLNLYRLVPFVVTGYAVPGQRVASNVTGFNPCHGADRCLYGYFVDLDLMPGAVGPDPGRDLGLAAVKTIG